MTQANRHTNRQAIRQAGRQADKHAQSDQPTFVVDHAVTVQVGLPDHLVHLLVRQLLAQVGHNVPELRCTDEPVTRHDSAVRSLHSGLPDHIQVLVT